MQSNKKQRTFNLSCPFSTKAQKEHALSVFEQSVYKYIDASGTSTDVYDLAQDSPLGGIDLPSDKFYQILLLLGLVVHLNNLSSPQSQQSRPQKSFKKV